MVVKVKSKNELRAHLKDRHMNLDLHNVMLSDEVATILLYNLSGQVVGYQRYNPAFPSAFPGDGKQSNLRDRRYYNYVSEGAIGLFGLESFHLNSPCVFITEGVFDACRLTNRGACAVAMLTNTPSSSMINFLHCLAKPLIAVCDNDAAGKKLRRVGHYHEVVQGAKDLGDCEEDYVDYLLAKYQSGVVVPQNLC
jgi:hypothetical protein